MYTYELRPKELYEATDLLNEVKRNPLVFRLLEELNEERKNSGKSPITVKVWRGLYFGGNCEYETGLIRINDRDPKYIQLETLVYEICNLDTTLELHRSKLRDKLCEGRYPLRREVYIKEQEKFGYLAIIRKMKIYRYGVRHLNWNAKLLKFRNKTTQKSFEEDYKYVYPYEEQREYKKKHKEYFGSFWDEALAWKEEKENHKKRKM